MASRSVAGALTIPFAIKRTNGSADDDPITYCADCQRRVGRLVMEINPSKAAPDAPIDLRPQWMYDQVVRPRRAAHS